MFQSPSPPEFLSKPGQRPGNWQSWYEDFLMYGEACGWSDWSDSRKTAFLLTSVGAEARRLYRAAVSADNVDLNPRPTGGGLFRPPLSFFRDNSRNNGRIVTKFCIPSPASILHVVSKNCDPSYDRSPANDVTVTSCSPD